MDSHHGPWALGKPAVSREQDFLERWQRESPAYEKWGEDISATVIRALADKIAPVSAAYFLKAPVKPRLKEGHKLVEKAFYRNKNYPDPYSDITDKVGTRFVVLLGRDIRQIVEIIEAQQGWVWSRDRDYEEEQKKNPIVFDYAAVHYVVRPERDLIADGVLIAAGTPCEVQIKTILQHAYSELTHDTIYKPQIQATPTMQRDAAKAMALLEATNDYFEKVADQVDAALSAVKEITGGLSLVYQHATGLVPSPSLLEGLLLESYEKSAGADFSERARILLETKPFLVDRIKDRVAGRNPLFSQPSILLAYLDIAARGPRALSAWPLTLAEMEPLLNDLGQSQY